MTGFTPITGHCQCGAVRFRVTAPPVKFYHCHCSMCRRCHGTVFGTYAVVPRENLVIERGEDNLTTFESSPGTRREFCKSCGCQLFAEEDARPALRLYTPATCDGWPGHAPSMERHIFVGSKLDWYQISDGLPQFDEY
ncbi:MAG: GFA family protein [Dongiaceae bacterium]